MSIIENNLKRIKSELPSNCELIVVSKYRSIEEIQETYQCGQRVFAENRVQALLERKEALPTDISWHLIGHLQTNKVKLIAPFISMIQSVDSIKLAQEINKHAALNQRNIDILLQVHVAQEDSKFGIPPSQWDAFIQEIIAANFPNIQIRGIMGMASFTENDLQINQEFATIQKLFQETQKKYFKDDNNFNQISIGMSGDYKIAVNFGSTMVRIGSAIFQ